MNQNVLVTKAGKVTVKGTTESTSHTINQEERSQFTAHINGVGTLLAILFIILIHSLFCIRYLKGIRTLGHVCLSQRRLCKSSMNAEVFQSFQYSRLQISLKLN